MLKYQRNICHRTERNFIVSGHILSPSLPGQYLGLFHLHDVILTLRDVFLSIINLRLHRLYHVIQIFDTTFGLQKEKGQQVVKDFVPLPQNIHQL